MAKAKPGSKTRRVLLVLAVILSVCVVSGGLVVYTSFQDYLLRARTMEASENLRAIFQGVAAYYDQHGEMPSASRTPPQTPCGREPVAWPNSSPEWDALGFRPLEPVRYSYEFLFDEEIGNHVVRAYGDLNCDGVESIHELSVDINDENRVYRAPHIYVINELE